MPPVNPVAPTTLAASLGSLADALVGVESSQALTAQLEEILGAAAALPARLYLYDSDQHTFFPAAGFACACGESELSDPPANGVLPDGFYPLMSRGEWVGQLEILAPRGYDRLLVGQLAQLLGPLLISVHRQTRLVEELHLVKAESTQFISAGGLLRHLDVEILLVRILEAVMGAVAAQVGAVLTVNDQGSLELRVALGLRDEHVRAIRTRDQAMVAQTVFTSGEPVCLDSTGVAAHLDLSALGASLDGLLALPLTTRDRTHGVVMLANPASAFGESQRRIAETVCGMAAIALDNALLVKSTLDRERLKREMDLAHSVQTQMYPKGGLQVARLLVDGGSQPCDETGGDYYTFLNRDACLLAMIGDVSGHGLGAALYTTMAHAVIQQQLRADAALEPAFVVLNEALYHTQSGRFMTAALVEVDPRTLGFRYLSAGHNPLLWLHGGEVRWLESCGIPLGITPDGQYPPATSGQLAVGDCLILYTDGFTEAVNRDGECYGEERLAAIGRHAVEAGLGPSAIMKMMTEDVDRWADGQDYEDDLTMVVICVTA